MASGPKIEHFDIFEEDVRLGISGDGANNIRSNIPEEYTKAMAELSPELQEQVITATRILKESAFPSRLTKINITSSGSGYQFANGQMEALNNGYYSSGHGNLTSQSLGSIGSSGFFSGGQMQSPIIYEKP